MDNRLVEKGIVALQYEGGSACAAGPAFPASPRRGAPRAGAGPAMDRETLGH